MLRIMSESGPVEEAFFNGYSVEERLLEDVMFRIRIEDGQIKCLGAEERHNSYMSKFFQKQIADWEHAVVKHCIKFGDDLTINGEDAWIEGEDEPAPDPDAKPRVIKALNGNSVMAKLQEQEWGG